MPLRELIPNKLVACQPDAPIKDVAAKMKDDNVGAILIVEKDKPLGIVTDRDIVLRCVCDGISFDTPVEQIMTKSVDVVTEDQGLYDVIRLMHDKEVRRVPVVDRSGKALGLLSFGDIIGLLARELGELSPNVSEKVAA